MGSEKFCLRWNDFESNISNAFKELRDDKDFFDVTLACEDEQIQAHKVILSACSPFFRNILRSNPHQHPLLYMRSVKFTDLQSVLNFMYHGEVNIAQEELNSFLSVAEDLRVKGLTQTQSVDPHHSSLKSTNSQPIKSSLITPKTLPRFTAKEPQRQNTPPPIPQQYEDIQEVVPVKSEPRDSVSDPHANMHPPNPPQSQVVPLEQNVTSYQEDTGYEDYGDYQEEHVYSDADISMDNMGAVQGTEPMKGENRNVLNQYIKKSSNDLGQPMFECTMCGIKKGQKVTVLNHVESVHFPNSFVYTCKYCQAEFYSLNARNVHQSRNHKNENKY